MEDLELNHGLFRDVYKQRRVFITGHTGFKGSWLNLWLQAMGARVTGYALPPATQPNHFQLLPFGGVSTLGDLADRSGLRHALKESGAEVVFHLAAQALVRASYQDPVNTFVSNVMGTVHLLEACRTTPSVRAVVIVTSDKCYQNNEWVWGYRESDPMGGADPYSASKGCAELVTQAYRASYFSGPGKPMVASARAGNVIGGGDWSPDRLLPDLIHGAVTGEPTLIRRPDAVRPWQHVLEPLSGYLLLGERLLAGDAHACGAWNFGPNPEGCMTVGAVARQAASYWEKIVYRCQKDPNDPHEAGMLRLDCAKARWALGWQPCWDIGEGLRRTVSWYKQHHENQRLETMQDLKDYVRLARDRGLMWTDMG